MRKNFLCTFNATASYALLQSVTWGFYAVILVFSSNVLYDFGFSDSKVSLLLGIATGLSCLLQVGAAEVVSRFPKLPVSGILLALGGVMLLCSLLLLIPGVSPLVGILAFGAACMVHQAIPSLTNALGMDSIRRGAATNYSLARGLGSLAYSLLALVTGLLVGKFGTKAVPTLGAILAAAMLLAVGWYRKATEGDLMPAVLEARQERKGGFLAQYPRFAVVLFGAVLLSLSHNLNSTFMYQIMLAKNGGAGEQGIASSISALVELPPMFLFPLMLCWLRCDKWVRLAALGMAVKPLMIFFASTPNGVYLAQVTQMVGFGLYTISSVNYAEMVVDKGESVRAQSYLGSTVTIGALIALSTGGVICDLFGVQTMVLASLAFGLLGGIIIALSAEKTEK